MSGAAAPAAATRTPRVGLAVLALAIGAFGIGTSESVTVGLALDLARDFAVRDSLVGNSVSAYALGVVVGAPVITALGARMHRRTLLLALLGVFLLGALASLASPSMGAYMSARFVAGLPHGAYFGVAAATAASLVPVERRGRTISLVFLGLTVANVAGVPTATLLGQQLGWRAAFVLVLAIGAVALAAVRCWVPVGSAKPDTSVVREIRALQRRDVWVTVALTAVGYAGIFCTFAFLAVIVTQVALLPAGVLPLVLAAWGVGMTLGTVLGGRLADWSVEGAIRVSFVAIVIALLLLGTTAHLGWAVVAGVFLLGVTAQMLPPAVQLRLMDAAPTAPSLAAAMAQSSFNTAAAVGSAVGGFVLASGAPRIAPAFVGIAFALGGLAIALTAHEVARRGRRRFTIDTHTGSVAIVPVLREQPDRADPPHDRPEPRV